jgi:hypothetical protein
MRARVVLLLCWVVILGNLIMAATVPTLIVRSGGELLAFAIQMGITNVLSFSCAVILRRSVLRERPSESTGSENTPSRKRMTNEGSDKKEQHSLPPSDGGQGK